MKNEKILNTKYLAWTLILTLLTFALSACQPPANETATRNTDNVNSPDSTASRQPTIEAAPVEAGEGNYKILTGEQVKLTVHAPDANQVELFYQPVTASDRLIKLKTVAEQSNGNFSAEIKTPLDFNGEVWARVHYANDQIKETERLQLVMRDAADDSNNEQAKADANAKTIAQDKSADTDESARADKFTGGKIQRAELQAGNGDIRVTVNVPAFKLTLWQNGKEIETYPVGVGRKNFPIPIGLRDAEKIILNPNWIPPDSEWVRESEGVEPYEKIPADSPDNPLGKIKIPLGDAYLLHEAQSPSDIGNLVSHGCVRVLGRDIFDLSQKIATARGLTDAKNKIAEARNDSERRVINLNSPLPVDINYDTIIVENGTLHIYPDVYERQANTTQNLRKELESHGVDLSQIDEKTLGEMLERVSDERFFSVSLADIKSGKALEKGKTEPLTSQQKEE